jgi:hypothetical protein
MMTFLKGAAMLVGLLVIVGCGQSGSVVPSAEPPAAEEAVIPAKPKIAVTVIDSSRLMLFLIVPDGGDTGQIVPDGSAYEIRSKAVDRVAVGDGDGVLVRVPADTAAQLGGRQVKIQITARSSPTNGAPTAKVMYFRPGSERGSGWQDMSLTSDFQPFAFEYVVPTGASTTGWDNIAFWADPEGKGRGIEVSAITVETVD